MTTKRKTGRPQGRKTAKVTEAKRQTVKAAKSKPKPVPPMEGPKGHRGIVAGSKKEQVAKIFDSKGREAAIVHGLKLDLARTTLQTWTSFWARDDKSSKPKSKRSPKAQSQRKAEPNAKEQRDAA